MSPKEENMRKAYIDNLRSGIILLVILYHIVYMFNSVGVLTNVVIPGIPQMDVVLYILYPWFMICMFALAGMSAKYALDHLEAKVRSGEIPIRESRKKKKSGKNADADRKTVHSIYIRSRAAKLVVPVVVGCFLYGWICGYVTYQYTDAWGGQGDLVPGFIRYLIFVMSGIGPGWFAVELFAATLVLLLIRKIDKQDKLYALCGKAGLAVLPLLTLLVWGSAQILNLPVVEIFRNGIYICTFLLGYYVLSQERIQEGMAKWWFVFAIPAVLLGIGYVITFWGQNYASTENLKGLLVNAYAWFMTLAVIAAGHRFLNQETAFTRYMRPRSFAFYLLHYLVLVLITYGIDSHFDVPVGGFYPILIAASVILLPPLYEILSRIPVVRRLILGITTPVKSGRNAGQPL